MARLDPPPPRRLASPVWHEIPVGERLIRLFNPESYGATAVSFRYYGPRLRFDHQRAGEEGRAKNDLERGIYYAAPDGGLSCCVVEIFGDADLIIRGPWRVARPKLTRDLRLLDLRGSGAMRAGTIAAVAKCPHAEAQPWSRHFYESPEYEFCDGLIYYNAHNDEEAIALYERASDALTCPDSEIIPLSAEELRDPLLRIAERNGLEIAPY